MERQYEHLYKNLYGVGAALICFLLLVPTLRLVPVDAQLPHLSADACRDLGLDRQIEDFFGTLRRGTASSIPASTFSSASSSALETLLRQSPLGTSSNDEVAALRAQVDD